MVVHEQTSAFPAQERQCHKLNQTLSNYLEKSNLSSRVMGGDIKCFSETYWSYTVSKISSSPLRIENPQRWRPSSMALFKDS